MVRHWCSSMSFVEFMITLGFCGHHLPNEVAFRVLVHGLGDFGASNLFAWANGIPRYRTRVLFVFKTMASPRTGPYVVLTISGTFADAAEQQAKRKILRIPRKTRMEWAIAFLVETRREIQLLTKEASSGKNGLSKQLLTGDPKGKVIAEIITN